MTTNHTPTPWTISQRDTGAVHTYHITHSDEIDPKVGNFVAWGCDKSDANAAFIVRACNSHDALVAALLTAKTLLSIHPTVQHWNETTGEAITPAAKEIDSTLAAAEAK